MAQTPRNSKRAKEPNDDYAALTLVDAAFSVSAVERRRKIGEALARDGRLLAFAERWLGERWLGERWLGERANARDVVDAVAADLNSFLAALAPETRGERPTGTEIPPPFDAVWRARLAAIGSRLAENVVLSQRFADELEAAKLAALKEFAYGAGHEINNPLANISARAQTLLRDESHGERRRALATINRQAMRAHEMISDLMLFARPPRMEVSEVDVAEVVRRVVDELAPLAEAQATQLVAREVDSPLIAVVDGGQLAVAVKAIVRNALEAVAAGGNVEATARIVDGPAKRDGTHDGTHDSPHDSPHDGNAAGAHIRRGPEPVATSIPSPRLLEVAVRDDGPGFSERELAHLFDPFFSGREAGRGLGFGLCLAWRIATDHGGQIALLTEPRRGAAVALTVPIASRAQEPVEKGD